MAAAIYYKTDEEIELIRQSCLLVSKTLAHVASLVGPGKTLKDLDTAAEEFIRDHGAEPGFKREGFPGTLCMSRNEEVVHGLPREIELADGDIISIDCGVYMNSFYGDSAYTFAVGEIDPDVMKLCVVTNESLYKGIEQAVHGNRVGAIGFAVQEHTQKKHGYGVVRALVGHGVGQKLHEGPEVPNYGRRGNGVLMKEGLVIAIEPMINLGTKDVRQLQDGWTIRTKDRRPSAHYEHTVAVKKGQADILSDHTELEEEIKKNPNLSEIQ